MRKETDYIIATLRNTLEGEPWYGRPAMVLLQEVDSNTVYKKPKKQSASLIELLYHMINWAEFTLRRLEKDKEEDVKKYETLDWRKIDSAEHTWEKGVAQFKVTHDLIIELLESKDDSMLGEMVEHREYNYRFLLNGLIQHDIYHIGQIAYLTKMSS